MSLDPGRHEVTRSGRRIELTPKEFAVLEVLLEAPARCRARSSSSTGSGRERGPAPNTVRMTVMTLPQARRPEVVRTVKGAGYRV